MDSQMSDEEEYRKLADAERAKAQAATDPYEKRTILLVAQRYDVLADRAKRRAQAAEGLDKTG
jgi:hypothetical protein